MGLQFLCVRMFELIFLFLFSELGLCEFSVCINKYI